MNTEILRRATGILASSLLLCAAFAASAVVPTGPGIFRAYLSLSGSDANPCTLLAPCRLLPAALAAVQDGGEVWILDSANYNTAPVAITKSVTILAIPGELGSLVGNGGNAVDIATAGIDVVLRNLNILNLAAGINGVSVTGGNNVTIQNCNLIGFGNSGIYVAGNVRVDILDSVIRDNSNGIYARQGTATIWRSHMTKNGYGVFASALASVTAAVHLNESSVTNSGQTGVASVGGTGTSRIYVSRSVSSNNGFDGFQASNGGEVTVSQSVATANGRYGFSNFSGTFRTTGDNLVLDNLSGDLNFAPPIPLPTK